MYRSLRVFAPLSAVTLLLAGLSLPPAAATTGTSANTAPREDSAAATLAAQTAANTKLAERPATATTPRAADVRKALGQVRTSPGEVSAATPVSLARPGITQGSTPAPGTTALTAMSTAEFEVAQAKQRAAHLFETNPAEAIRESLSLAAGQSGLSADPTPGDDHFVDGVSRVDPSKGDEHTTVFANPDGTFTAQVYEGQVNFKQANGTWAPVDNTVVASASGDLVPAAGGHGIRFSPRGRSGSLTSMTFPGGGTLTTSLVGAADVTALRSGSTVHYPNILPGVDVTYDATGTGIKETLTPTSYTAPSAGAVAYTYDKSGNRITAGAVTATYDSRNEITVEGTTAYTYTAAGQRLRKTPSGKNPVVTNYTFDAYGRAITDGSTTNSYDPMDRLLTNGASSFGYAGAETEPVSDGTTLYSHSPAGGTYAQSRSGVATVVVANGHGDTVGLIGPNAAATSGTAAFNAWGTRVSTSGTASSLGFQSQWTQTDGKVHMGARWYDPAQGAFTSQDPAGSGSNWYAYAGGDPVSWSDPSGLLRQPGPGFMQGVGVPGGAGPRGPAIGGGGAKSTLASTVVTTTAAVAAGGPIANRILSARDEAADAWNRYWHYANGSPTASQAGSSSGSATSTGPRTGAGTRRACVSSYCVPRVTPTPDPPRTPRGCPAGQTLVRGHCQSPTQAKVRCPAGSVLSGGRCVTARVTVVTPPEGKSCHYDCSGTLSDAPAGGGSIPDPVSTFIIQLLAAIDSGDLPVDVSAGLSGHPFDDDPGAAFLNGPNDPRQDYQEAPRLPSYTMRTADGRFCFTNYNSVGQRLNDVCKNWEELTEAEKDEVAGAYGATYWAADSVVQVSRTAEGAADGSGISLSAARAAAERNGIDTRLMDLSHEPGSPGQYGFTSFNGAGSLIRGATGRFQVTLTNLGLRSEADAVNTIAHELNHIREGMLTGGLPPSEGPAIWSGDTAELFFR